jgi:radical SAM protein with 4Fe4S-binding SPASM domain
MNKPSDFFTHRKKRILASPVMMNLEITDACNIKCRHCYNFWREDSTSATNKLDKGKIDHLVEEISQAGVFHVVLTGGEPFANFETLVYSLTRMTEKGISTSVNTNLMLVTPEKIRRLKEAGLDHVLTSMVSCDAKTNDYLMNKEGALETIIEGIKTTIACGIRVSVNMVISDVNIDQVYDTAKRCSEIGVQRVFGTRLVPSVNLEEPTESDMKLDQESAKKGLDQLIRAKEDFGIGIGSLVSYPLCLLGDLNKYRDFVGRGCPAKSGIRMSVNADGTAHACTHEEEGYGNILKEGIKEVFSRMDHWHDGSYLFEGCKDCAYIDVCGSGCSMASEAYFKTKDSQDPLWRGHEEIGVPFKLEIPSVISGAVDSGEKFEVPSRVRFRKENGFYVVNIRWANAFTIESDLAEYMQECQKNKKCFTLTEMKTRVADARTSLIYMIFKDGIEPVEENLKMALDGKEKVGASVNPFELPVESTGTF